ncbi:ice nucleation protein [Aplysia californica]|uniref:Ice nucleation protein n=1 Tax=Aplysia californica TaxID=6500 RepID=A0ABM1VY55_APLCA|nr:ice nucleation protein [Aplysia californica]
MKLSLAVLAVFGLFGACHAQSSSGSGSSNSERSPSPKEGYNPSPGEDYASKLNSGYNPSPGEDYASKLNSGYNPSPGEDYASKLNSGYNPSPGEDYASQLNSGYNPSPGSDYNSNSGSGYSSNPSSGYNSNSDSGDNSSPSNGYSSNPNIGYSSNADSGYSSNSGSGYSSNSGSGYSSNAGSGYSSNPSRGYNSNSGSGYSSNSGSGYSSNPSSGYNSNFGSGYNSNSSSGYNSNSGSGYSSNSGSGYSSNPVSDYSPFPSIGYNSNPSSGYSSNTNNGYSPNPSTGYSLTPSSSYSSNPSNGGYGSNSNSGYNSGYSNRVPSYEPQRSYSRAPSYGGYSSSVGYGPTRPTSYYGDGYGGASYGSDREYRGYQDDRYAEQQLDRLDSFLENLEGREMAQLDRLGRLKKSANANVDFKKTFKSSIYPEVQGRQQLQAYRLNALQDTLNRIRGLRSQVQNLQNRANDVRGDIESTIYPARKRIMYGVSDLQNVDSEKSNRIDEARGRANATSERVDTLADMAAESQRDLDETRNSVKITIRSTNRQHGTSVITAVDPNGQNAPANTTVDFTPSFDGIPQYSPSAITGFRVVRNHHYANDYPSIYFGIEDNIILNNRAEFSSKDFSSGGYRTERIVFNAAFGNFDIMEPRNSKNL